MKKIITLFTIIVGFCAFTINAHAQTGNNSNANTPLIGPNLAATATGNSQSSPSSRIQTSEVATLVSPVTLPSSTGGLDVGAEVSQTESPQTEVENKAEEAANNRVSSNTFVGRNLSAASYLPGRTVTISFVPPKFSATTATLFLLSN